MPTFTNPKSDRRALTHTGAELGLDHVTLSQNATGREDPVIEWECPRKYERITYAAGRHLTKFVPRAREEISGTTGDDTVVSLTTDIQPPHGELADDDQNYDAVVAYNVTAGAEYDIVDYDYAANEVTLGTDPADGDTVALWPVIIEGDLKFIGHDQFGHRIAALDQWGIPIHVFNDFNQQKNQTEVHLTGAVSWEESEKLALYVDSPRQVVWDDADYPRGQYASTIEQRVDVDV
jgi:hypothetical protein